MNDATSVKIGHSCVSLKTLMWKMVCRFCITNVFLCAYFVVCLSSWVCKAASYQVGFVIGGPDAGDFVSIPRKATTGWLFKNYDFNSLVSANELKGTLIADLATLDMIVFCPTTPQIMWDWNEEQNNQWKSFLARGGTIVVTSAQSQSDCGWMWNQWMANNLDSSYWLPTAPIGREELVRVTNCWGKGPHPFRSFPSPLFNGMNVWGRFLPCFWGRGENMGNQWTMIDDWEGAASYGLGQNGAATVMAHYGKGTLCFTCFREPYFEFFENVRAWAELHRAGLKVSAATSAQLINNNETIDFTIDSIEDATPLSVSDYFVKLKSQGIAGSLCETNVFGVGTSSGLRFTFNFLNTIRGAGSVYMALCNAHKNKEVVLVDRQMVFDDDIEFNLPNYRQLVSTARRQQAIQLGFRVNPLAGTCEGLTWQAQVRYTQGSVVWQHEGSFAPSSNQVEFAADIPYSAPAGEYVFCVTLFDATGELFTRETRFKIVAPTDTQIVADQDNVLLRAGKPWLPIGVWGSSDADCARVAQIGFDLQHAMVWTWGEGGETDPFRQMRALGQPMILELAPQNKYETNMRNWMLGMSKWSCAGMMYTVDEPGDQDLQPWESAYQAMVQADINHPVCYANRYANSSGYQSGIADIVFSDPYAGYERDMMCLDIMNQSLKNSKPILSLINMGECPDEKTLRLLTYGSLVHGAQGVMYYLWGNIKDTLFERTYFPQLIKEIRSITPQLTSLRRRRLSLAQGTVEALDCGENSEGRVVVCVNPTESTAFVTDGIEGFSDTLIVPAKQVVILDLSNEERLKSNSHIIPQTWKQQYPHFEELYGSDFVKALAATTGKVDAQGRPLTVMDDFIAGTDPTDITQQFRANISVENNQVVVSWEPKLSDSEEANRIYKIYGSTNVNGPWVAIDKVTSPYQFFKVSVQLKP